MTPERTKEVIDNATRAIDENLHEIARLKSLLRRTVPFINDTGNDEEPEAQSRANELFIEIAAALSAPPTASVSAGDPK